VGIQTRKLSMAAIGIDGDVPPHQLQPTPLTDGIHLRWFFGERGFPMYGFYLLRREHIRDVHARFDLARWFESLSLEDLNNAGTSLTLTTPEGTHPITLSSDQPLDFPNLGTIDLHNRHYIFFSFEEAFSLRTAYLTINADNNSQVTIDVFSFDRLVDRKIIQGTGINQSVKIESDAITSIKISGNGFFSTNIVYLTVETFALPDPEEPSWKFVAYLTLPVSHIDYLNNHHPTMNSARAVAKSRIKYGPTDIWDEPPATSEFPPADLAGYDSFENLHQTLVAIVTGSQLQSQEESSIDGTVEPEEVPSVSIDPTKFVLMGSLHSPAIAQSIGLYFVDEGVRSDTEYDYLLLADYTGVLADNPLSWLLSEGFHHKQSLTALDSIEAWISFKRQKGVAPPLDTLINPKVYDLPVPTELHGAGLTWNLERPDIVLPEQETIQFHLWRSDKADSETYPPPEPDPATYQPKTKDEPILAARMVPQANTEIQYPPGWPPISFNYIDYGLSDGWYSYKVSGVDIFGRHTQQMNSSPWYDASDTNLLHPFAVHLYDKIGPPSPTGIEAYSLDTGNLHSGQFIPPNNGVHETNDPLIVQDQPYLDWRNQLRNSPWYTDPTFTDVQRDNLIGLRVKWKWTASHREQAPDTKEFRIYYNPGHGSPSGASRSINWDRRYFVVDYNTNFEEVVEDSGETVRNYEIFLPLPSDIDHQGLPLVVNNSQPTVYANIGVSAADNSTYHIDPRSTSAMITIDGRWANRTGNEGPLGSPAVVYRVKRDPPLPPQIVDTTDGSRIYATPANYHGHSYYRYSWPTLENLKVHVYRIMDETLFWADRQNRPRADHLITDDIFPQGSRWNNAKKGALLPEINRLNQPFATEQEAFDYYRHMSNDALQVLAGLAENVNAYSQTTLEPLTESFFDDTLDGKVDTFSVIQNTAEEILQYTTRYFYRCAYVDGAQNQSELSLSSPPIWIPDVIPPKFPRISKILSGDPDDTAPQDGKITISFTSNKDPDITEYRIYRVDNMKALEENPDLLTPIHTIPVSVGNPSPEVEISWTDVNVDPSVTFFILLKR